MFEKEKLQPPESLDGANAVKANLTDQHVLGSPEREALRLDKRKQGYDKALAEAQADVPGGLVREPDVAHDMANHMEQARQHTEAADQQDARTIKAAEQGHGMNGDLEMVLDRQSANHREDAHAASMAALDTEQKYRADEARGVIAELNIPPQRSASSSTAERPTFETAAVSP
jgi:hypothetical protein